MRNYHSDIELENMNMDLCACYDFMDEPPADLVEAWRHAADGPLPTLENTSFYVTEPDGTQYFYCGDTRIKVSEHFAEAGKPMSDLVKDVIQYKNRAA